MHKLYLLLQHCLPEKEEAHLLDEIDKMLHMAEPGTLLKSLEIIYKKDFTEKNTVELLVLFVTGLKNINFFEYVGFVKGMNRSGK